MSLRKVLNQDVMILSIMCAILRILEVSNSGFPDYSGKTFSQIENSTFFTVNIFKNVHQYKKNYVKNNIYSNEVLRAIKSNATVKKRKKSLNISEHT